jgi:hypothetical protein
LAEHFGRADAHVLPLDKLFDGIAAKPSAPEYWWVYALLLSTTTVIGAAIGWLPGGLSGAIGSALTILLAAVGAIGGLVFLADLPALLAVLISAAK